jgi:N-glycosylase/DNA lyase
MTNRDIKDILRNASRLIRQAENLIKGIKEKNRRDRRKKKKLKTT